MDSDIILGNLQGSYVTKAPDGSATWFDMDLQQHGPQIPMWPQVAAQTPGICMIFKGISSHGHQLRPLLLKGHGIFILMQLLSVHCKWKLSLPYKVLEQCC